MLEPQWHGRFVQSSNADPFIVYDIPMNFPNCRLLLRAYIYREKTFNVKTSKNKIKKYSSIIKFLECKKKDKYTYITHDFIFQLYIWQNPPNYNIQHNSFLMQKIGLSAFESCIMGKHLFNQQTSTQYQSLSSPLNSTCTCTSTIFSFYFIICFINTYHMITSAMM